MATAIDILGGNSHNSSAFSHSWRHMKIKRFGAIRRAAMRWTTAVTFFCLFRAVKQHQRHKMGNATVYRGRSIRIPGPRLAPPQKDVSLACRFEMWKTTYAATAEKHTQSTNVNVSKSKPLKDSSFFLQMFSSPANRCSFRLRLDKAKVTVMFRFRLQLNAQECVERQDKREGWDRDMWGRGWGMQTPCSRWDQRMRQQRECWVGVGVPWLVYFTNICGCWRKKLFVRITDKSHFLHWHVRREWTW